MNYPFDVSQFIKENRSLVKKFLRKNTLKLEVPDFEPTKEDFYSNDIQLLNIRAKFEYSDLQKLEYIKCMRDVVYFSKKYVKIISIDDGIINFIPYEYQNELLGLFQDSRFVVAMQARQSGKCVDKNTLINIRNKQTGEVKQITIEEFHELQRQNE